MATTVETAGGVTRPDGSTTPACWTQYANTADASETLEVTIGLDFGTAFTQVVIGQGSRSYAIPVGSLRDDASEEPYVLPCRLAIAEGGSLSFGRGSGGRTVSGLKLRLMDGNRDAETLTHVIGFMALVLQQARRWFMSQHENVYRHNRFNWNINVGVPTAYYSDTKISDRYRKLVSAAWYVSTKAEYLTLPHVRSVGLEGGALLHPDNIAVFPEFATQVNGYARSPMRRSDLHLLMDVGAGTVDVSVFNVYVQEDEDLFPIFAGVVKRFGADVLCLHRLRTTPNGGLRKEDVDQGVTDDVAHTLRVSRDVLDKLDKPFQKAIHEQANEAVTITRPQYPRSRCWKNGVTFMLCGGGSHLKFYATVGQVMLEKNMPCPLNSVAFPKPGNLFAPGVSEADYHRLSVAYGLSFDQFDIGELRYPEPIDDRPGSSRICRACGGSGGSRGNDCRQCGGKGWFDAVTTG